MNQFSWHSCVTIAHLATDFQMSRLIAVTILDAPGELDQRLEAAHRFPYVATTAVCLNGAQKNCLIILKSLICCNIQACSWLPWRGWQIWDWGRTCWLVGHVHLIVELVGRVFSKTSSRKIKLRWLLPSVARLFTITAPFVLVSSQLSSGWIDNIYRNLEWNLEW